MSEWELNLWRAEYDREPWGESRDDWRMGQICSTVANCHSTNHRFKPSDFIPDWDAEPVVQDSEDHKRIFQQWSAVQTREED